MKLHESVSSYDCCSIAKLLLSISKHSFQTISVHNADIVSDHSWAFFMYYAVSANELYNFKRPKFIFSFILSFIYLFIHLVCCGCVCTGMCGVCTFLFWGQVSCSVTLSLSPLRPGLLLNPELAWWPICLSDPLDSVSHHAEVEEAFGQSFYTKVKHLCSGPHACALSAHTLWAFPQPLWFLYEMSNAFDSSTWHIKLLFRESWILPS